VVRGFDEGENVEVKVVRNGSERSFDVRLSGIESSGDSGDNEFDWRSDDNFPTPPTPPVAPRAPRAPRAPSAPSAPRTYWFHDEDSDGHLKKSLEGLKELEKLKAFEGFEGWNNLDGDRVMVRSLGRGRLGVQIEDLDDDTADQLDIRSGHGALVRSVVDDSPARRAGMKAGDVIIRVNEERIENSEDLVRTIRGLNDGPARITVVRRGGTQTLTANIAPRAESPNVMRFQGPRSTRERTLMGDRARDRADRMRMFSDRDRENGDLQREIESLKREVEQLRRELDRRDDR